MLEANRLNALVVDDNAYARSAASATLRQLGVSRIVEVEGGAAAIGCLLAERFDLLFMDWYMPEMSGAALLEVVRDPRFGPHGALPIILMTAYPSRENVVKAKGLGVNEVMVKPLTTEHVSIAMRRLLPGGWELPGDDGQAAGDVGKVFL
jgi:two-component system chemotaxis response regulator CheY